MGNFAWSHPERLDLYLASRTLAGRSADGDWTQWASDTLLQQLELHEDPRQGAGAWLFQDEVSLATELGEKLWQVVKADPYSAAELLADAAASGPVRIVAAALVASIEANGRGVP